MLHWARIRQDSRGDWWLEGEWPRGSWGYDYAQRGGRCRLGEFWQ